MGDYVAQELHSKGIDVHIGVQKQADLDRCVNTLVSPLALKVHACNKDRKTIGTFNYF